MRARSFTSPLRGLQPRIALPVLFAINGMFLGAWVASIPEITSDLELTRHQLGRVLPAMPLGGLVAFTLAAAVIRRFGSRGSLLGFGVLRTLTLPLLAIASTAEELAAALAIIGLAHGGLDVSLNAQAVEVEHQGGVPFLARAHAAYSVGTLGGSLAFGQLERTSIPLQPMLLVPAVIGLALFIVLVPTLLRDRPVPPKPVAARVRSSPVARLRMLPPMLLMLLAIAFVTEIADEGIADWFELHLREDLQSLPAVASLNFSIFSGAILAGRIFGDVLASRLSPLRLLQVCGSVGGIGMLIGAGIDTTFSMLLGTAITGLGYSLIIPTLYRLAGSVPGLPPATALSLIATAIYLGFMVGPMLIGPVSGVITLRGALMVVGLLFFLVPVLAQIARVHPRFAASPEPQAA